MQVHSRGFLEAEVATVDEVEQAVAAATATPTAPEDEGHSRVFAVHSAPAAACISETSARALSSSSSSDFIVLGNDSDSDFVAHEDGGWDHSRQ